MKKHFLLKIFSLILSLFFFSVSYGQEAKTSSCPNPAGGCDTVGIEHRVSPWRVGGFIGPAVAFCGKWSSTFNSNKYRDKSLFNGIGYHANLNADYFFNTKKNKQLKFGVGAIAGLQTFFLRNDLDDFLDKIIAESGSGNAVIRKGASEDHYIVAGPVLSYALGKSGIEPKFKFVFEPVENFIEDDFSMEKIVSKILLGPTISSPLAVSSVRRMLELNKKTDFISRLQTSTIPFRSN